MMTPLRRTDQGEQSPLDRLREASTVGKYHLRLPTLLLDSRNHPATSVAVFLLIDSRSGPHSPAVMRREVGASRIGLSTAQWKRAMTPLLTAHDNAKGVQPAFVQMTRRGQGRAAARTVVTAAQYVKIPVHALDLLTATEHSISLKALRLLAAVWHLQPKNNGGDTRPPWCEVSATELAKTAGVSPVTVPTLRRELEEAGMVLVDVADGRSVVILPLARDLTTEEQDELGACLRAVLDERDGGRIPYRPRSGKPAGVETGTPAAGDVERVDTTPKKRADKSPPLATETAQPAVRRRRQLGKGWKQTSAGGHHGETA